MAVGVRGASHGIETLLLVVVLLLLLLLLLLR
jgi:hypothetical protein